jgi:hypothetical protein
MADASRLAGYVTDVTDEAAAGRFIDRILANHRPLDALVQKISTRRHDGPEYPPVSVEYPFRNTKNCQEPDLELTRCSIRPLLIWSRNKRPQGHFCLDLLPVCARVLHANARGFVIFVSSC